MLITDAKYWNEKYQNNETGWDIGYASTPIIEYVNQLPAKELQILIPGCGNGWEAEYLINNGFKNTHIIDISDEAIKRFTTRVPHFPKENVFHADFFKHQNTYDLILEQTFLSALHPDMRPDYARQMHRLLKSNGKLAGVIFGVELFHEHPPYGGNKQEYKALFAPYFDIRVLDEAYNSIKPRAGSELFIILQKKKWR